MIRTAFLALAAASLALEASAQAPAPIPRTPEGKPDFQGVWSNLYAVPLQRRPGLPLAIGEAQAKVIAAAIQPTPGASIEVPFFGPDLRSPLQVRGEFRSSVIIDPTDGRIPYTAAGQARLTAGDGLGLDSPEERSTGERCMGLEGAPSVPRPVGNFRQVVQTSDSLVIWADYAAEVRIIPFDGRRPAIGLRQGEARAQWEGDALVVETTAFRAADRVRANFAITPQTRITERFTLMGRDEIHYEFKVEDTELYTRAWRGEAMFQRESVNVYEFNCHEGNYALANILRGARVVEERAAKTAKAKQ